MPGVESRESTCIHSGEGLIVNPIKRKSPKSTICSELFASHIVARVHTGPNLGASWPCLILATGSDG